MLNDVTALTAAADRALKDPKTSAAHQTARQVQA